MAVYLNNYEHFLQGQAWMKMIETQIFIGEEQIIKIQHTMGLIKLIMD